METLLMTCPECNVEFQYYDFLSHTNNNTNSCSNTATHELTNYNGMNDYGNYLGNTHNITNSPEENNNLYNPMLNRGFQNSNSNTNTNTNDTTYLINNISQLTINTSLDKHKLMECSRIIQCNERTDCPICLCSYPKETSFYIMNCNHSFCIECCEKWFSSNSCCPLCRMNYN